MLGATVLLALYALSELIYFSIRAFFSFQDTAELSLALVAHNVLMGLVVVALALLAAALVISGKDAGRALGLAVSGYGVLAGFSGVTFQAIFLFYGDWDLGGLAIVLGMVFLAFLAAAVFFLLLSRGVADWVAQQRPAR